MATQSKHNTALMMREQLSIIDDIRDSINDYVDDIDEAREDIDDEQSSISDSLDTIDSRIEDIEEWVDAIDSHLDELEEHESTLRELIDEEEKIIQNQSSMNEVNALLLIMKSMNDENGIIEDIIDFLTLYLDEKYEKLDNKVMLFKETLDTNLHSYEKEDNENE